MTEKVRAPSIHDVAAHAGVSHQTVSRFLNGYTGIRPATRKRVNDAIQELGYRRNMTAWTLATGRSHTIGMIGPEVPDIGPLSSLHSVERAARDAGFHTLTTSSSSKREDVRTAIEFMLTRPVDALVIIAQQQSMQEVADEMVGSVPVVHLLSGVVGSLNAVSIDQRAGIEAAMGHLIELGHTAIQHVCGPLDYAEARVRRDAYRDIVEREGLEELPVIEGDWTADTGYAAGALVDPRATAVLCANDQGAFGLMHGLSDRGLQIPRDISVVGFDDTPEARHSTPPLTTVHQDFERVGKLAVSSLVDRLDKSSGPVVVSEPLMPWLVVRGSTAPLATR